MIKIKTGTSNDSYRSYHISIDTLLIGIYQNKGYQIPATWEPATICWPGREYQTQEETSTLIECLQAAIQLATKLDQGEKIVNATELHPTSV